MSRKQKRVYVDEATWSAIKAENGLSTDSNVQDHVMEIYKLADALKEIHPSLRTAIGKALAYHDLLKDITVSAQITLAMDGDKVAALSSAEKQKTSGGSVPPKTFGTERLPVDSNSTIVGEA